MCHGFCWGSLRRGLGDGYVRMGGKYRIVLNWGPNWCRQDLKQTFDNGIYRIFLTQTTDTVWPFWWEVGRNKAKPVVQKCAAKRFSLACAMAHILLHAHIHITHELYGGKCGTLISHRHLCSVSVTLRITISFNISCNIKITQFTI
jgi:hypothetical protein